MVKFESLTQGSGYQKGASAHQPALGPGSPSLSELLHPAPCPGGADLPTAGFTAFSPTCPVVVGSPSHIRSCSWPHSCPWMALLGFYSLDTHHTSVQNRCCQLTWTASVSEDSCPCLHGTWPLSAPQPTGTPQSALDLHLPSGRLDGQGDEWMLLLEKPKRGLMLCWCSGSGRVPLLHHCSNKPPETIRQGRR